MAEGSASGAAVGPVAGRAVVLFLADLSDDQLLWLRAGRLIDESTACEVVCERQFWAARGVELPHVVSLEYDAAAGFDPAKVRSARVREASTLFLEPSPFSPSGPHAAMEVCASADALLPEEVDTVKRPGTSMEDAMLG